MVRGGGTKFSNFSKIQKSSDFGEGSAPRSIREQKCSPTVKNHLHFTKTSAEGLASKKEVDLVKDGSIYIGESSRTIFEDKSQSHKETPESSPSWRRASPYNEDSTILQDCSLQTSRGRIGIRRRRGEAPY